MNIFLTNILVGLHIPVLLNEVCEYLTFVNNKIFVDATLGLGGHSIEIIERNDIERFVGIDMDESNLLIAKSRITEKFLRINASFIKERFENIGEIITKLNLRAKVNSILFDFGICSTHVDCGEKGFSFRQSGPLDMRYDKEQKLTAYEIINKYSENTLEKIFREYGEEKFSREIASKIVERRKKKVFETTIELSELIEDVIPTRGKIHPATRVFQALRIEVNDELNQIKKAITDSIDLLDKHGRIAVITYHSLEDTIVKHLFKNFAKNCICPPKQMQCTCRDKALIKILTKKPIIPQASEVSRNKRARSGKLRVIEKL